MLHEVQLGTNRLIAYKMQSAHVMMRPPPLVLVQSSATPSLVSTNSSGKDLRFGEGAHFRVMRELQSSSVLSCAVKGKAIRPITFIFLDPGGISKAGQQAILSILAFLLTIQIFLASYCRLMSGFIAASHQKMKALQRSYLILIHDKMQQAT